jgi:alkylation response protein AidB-like acyl-CoA dehydrogenase
MAAHVITTETEALACAHSLADAFAVDASLRDRERILPVAEIERFSHSGLWAVTVPKAFGGADLSDRAVAKIIEIISAADPSIGKKGG